MNNEIHPFRAHRHFVVIPLIAFLLLFPLFWVRHAQTSASDTRIPVIAGLLPGKSINLPNGISIAAGGERPVEWVQSGSEINLRKGTIIFAAQGFGTLHVGSWTLKCVAGGFFLSITNQITVAPLTTPVLMTDAKGHSVLLPPSSQWSPKGSLADLQDGVTAWWTERTVRPVPQLFVNTQMAYLQPLFQGGIDTLPPPVETQPSAPYDENQVFGFVRTLAAIGDDSSLQSFLADPDVAALVQKSSVRTVALPAFARMSGVTSTELALLPFLLQDETSALLLQFHPAFQSVAWMLPSVTLSREELLLRFFSLPHFDFQHDAIDPSVVERWEAAAKDLLKVEQDVPSVLIPFIADMSPLLPQLAQQGYPERAVRYADAITRLVEPYAEYLPLESQHLAKSIHDLSRSLAVAPMASPLLGSLFTDTSSSSSERVSSSAASSSSVLPPGELLAATKKALVDAGILLTVQTKFSVVPNGLVTVESVAVGNRLLDFTYDVGKNVVSHIIEDGQELPNSLPLVKFVDWGKKQ